MVGTTATWHCQRRENRKRTVVQTFALKRCSLAGLLLVLLSITACQSTAGKLAPTFIDPPKVCYLPTTIFADCCVPAADTHGLVRHRRRGDRLKEPDDQTHSHEAAPPRLGDLLRIRKQRGAGSGSGVDGTVRPGQHVSTLLAQHQAEAVQSSAVIHQTKEQGAAHVRANVMVSHPGESGPNSTHNSTACPFPEMRHLCRRLKHQGGSRHRAPDFIENAVRAVGLRKDCKVGMSTLRQTGYKYLACEAQSLGMPMAGAARAAQESLRDGSAHQADRYGGSWRWGHLRQEDARLEGQVPAVGLPPPPPPLLRTCVCNLGQHCFPGSKEWFLTHTI